MKNRIVLSCLLALSLACLACGCETDFARAHDDVDDKITSQTQAVEGTPDAAPAPPGDNGIGTSPSIFDTFDAQAGDSCPFDVCPPIMPRPCAIWVGPDAQAKVAAHKHPNMVMFAFPGTSCVDAYYIAELYWGEGNYVLRQVDPGWIAF